MLKYKGGKGEGDPFFYYLKVNIGSDISWDLGVTTNNEAKAFAMYQRLQRLKAHGIKQASIIRCSSIIIKFLLNLSIPQSIGLSNWFRKFWIWLSGLSPFPYSKCYGLTMKV
jgi:hypothetical protein